jgi:predicted ribosome quality control (RQC) complex YloA/Tae2 family protein
MLNYHIKQIEIEGINGDIKEYEILIGKSASGNEEIIKMGKKIHKDNIWFHFGNGVSGPHIMLCSNGDIIPKRYLIQVAAMLFEYKSKVPVDTSVIYTEVKNVNLTNVLGTVIPKDLRTIRF